MREFTCEHEIAKSAEEFWSYRLDLDFDRIIASADGQDFSVERYETSKDAEGHEIVDRDVRLTFKKNPVPKSLQSMLKDPQFAFNVSARWYTSLFDEAHAMSYSIKLPVFSDRITVDGWQWAEPLTATSCKLCCRVQLSVTRLPAISSKVAKGIVNGMLDAYRMMPQRVEEYARLRAKKLAAAGVPPPPLPPPRSADDGEEARGSAPSSEEAVEAAEEEAVEAAAEEAREAAAEEGGAARTSGGGEEELGLPSGYDGVLLTMREKTLHLRLALQQAERDAERQAREERVGGGDEERGEARRAGVLVDGSWEGKRKQAEREACVTPQELLELRKYITENKTLRESLEMERLRSAALEHRLLAVEKALAQERSLGKAMMQQLRLKSRRSSMGGGALKGKPANSAAWDPTTPLALPPGLAPAASGPSAPAASAPEVAATAAPPGAAPAAAPPAVPPSTSPPQLKPTAAPPTAGAIAAAPSAATAPPPGAHTTPAASAPGVAPAAAPPGPPPPTAAAPGVSPAAAAPGAPPTAAAPRVNPTSAPQGNSAASAPGAQRSAAAPMANPTAAALEANPTASAPGVNPTASAPRANPTASAPKLNPTALEPGVDPTATAPRANPTATAPELNPTAAASRVGPSPPPKVVPAASAPGGNTPASPSPTSAPKAHPTASAPNLHPNASPPQRAQVGEARQPGKGDRTESKDLGDGARGGSMSEVEAMLTEQVEEESPLQDLLRSIEGGEYADDVLVEHLHLGPQVLLFTDERMIYFNSQSPSKQWQAQWERLKGVDISADHSRVSLLLFPGGGRERFDVDCGHVAAMHLVYATIRRMRELHAQAVVMTSLSNQCSSPEGSVRGSARS